MGYEINAGWPHRYCCTRKRGADACLCNTIVGREKTISFCEVREPLKGQLGASTSPRQAVVGTARVVG
jgi:hypothetical protein